MELRPYQQLAVASVIEAMATNLNVLLQAPTAAGKTIMFSSLIKHLLSLCPTGRILMLAHRQELIAQAEQKLLAVWPDCPRIAIACAGMDKKVVTDGSIVIASVQTLARRLDDLMPFNLCIVDEAHRLPDATNRDSQYITLIEALRLQNPEMRLLGVTATPYRLGHGYIYGKECKEGTLNLFTDLHHQISVKELLEHGYLSPMRAKVAMQTSLIEALGAVKVKGDYAEGELGEVMGRSVYVKAAIEALEKHGPDRQHIIVFACTIKHAELLRAAFRDAGYDAACVHSATFDHERKRILDDFVAGRLRVLINVAVLIEGFDAPLTDCIIMARPTLSAALYLQQAGRGLRISDGKTDCLLIDMVGNVLQFGADFDAVQVKVPRLSNDDAKAPCKACPECDSPVHASARECPECGYQWPVEMMERQQPGRYADVELNRQAEAVEASVIGNPILAPYTSRSGNEMLRLELLTDSLHGTVFHYLNFDEDAHWYQRQKSRTWWKQIHGWDDDPPENNDAACFLFRDDLVAGMRVKLKKDGDFVKVAGW